METQITPATRLAEPSGLATWEFYRFLQELAEGEYLPLAGGTMTGALELSASTSVALPVVTFDGDEDTGIGHSAADTLDFSTGGVSRHQIGPDGSQLSVIPGGTTLLPEFKCRAFATFDASSGTPTLQASGNIASITDNGLGDYTFNFTTNMPDANYVVVASGGISSNAGYLVSILSKSTSAVRVTFRQFSPSAVVDITFGSVAMLR